MVIQNDASTHTRNSDLRGRPLVVGEVLFDVMPDGNRILGGAPFNVAWHLQAFGLKPLLITRVGAGDAFSAVYLLGLMKGWSTSTTLERALEFAAAVCTRPGATTTDRRLYSDFRHQGRWDT
jgi:fructokinase